MSERTADGSAGAGSYELADREVTAVEPSAAMCAQRPAHRASAVDATAEQLPFDDDSFDAAMTTFSVPQACTDGFTEAYYGRPERLLDAEAQLACSAWSLVGNDVIYRFTQQLTADLLDGSWDSAHGALRTQPQYEGSLVVVVSEP